MKKAILASLLALVISATAFAAPDHPSVNDKVLKVFSHTFESAQAVSWSEFQNVIEARFTFNDIITRVIYDQEGNTLQTIRYYYEKQLPLGILTKVKSAYEDQTVHSVTEVTVGDRTQYFITLEDAKTWTMVVADNSGSLTLDKKLNKA